MSEKLYWLICLVFTVSLALPALAADVEGEVPDDPELVREVANLVEQPLAILGAFDEAYLDLPAQVLITVMKKHQRYFPVERSGELAPYFITVANGAGLDADAVRHGNEAVVRARFADAAYFWKRDTATPLAAFTEALAGLTFQDALGSVLDKVHRLEQLAPQIASRLGFSDDDIEAARRAAALSKSDLATSMVVDFTSLQGVVGREYALRSGESPEVAEAIYEQYLPRGAGDELPQSPAGVALALADRLDSLTGLFAATIAVGQYDIKKVLAYSTISQLGFMVAAVGMGAFVAGMFHLVAHAFFKALLFLSAGSVILGIERGHHHLEHEHHEGGDEHEEVFDPGDMRNMGGLRKKMPVTFWVYLIGAIALAGVPPFAGFFSKDEILTEALELNFISVDVLLALAAVFTAFYMGRQIWLVFFGEPRHEAAGHAVESPAIITVPLMILAFLAMFGGGLNIPRVHTFTLWLKHYFEEFDVHLHAAEFNYEVAISATLLALLAMPLGLGIGLLILEFGVEPILDWSPYLPPLAVWGTPGLVILAAWLAHGIPARRIAKLDPARVLSHSDH